MTAPNDEGAGARDANPLKTNQNPSPKCASDEGVSKAFATLRAELALRGFGLHEMADSGYFVSKWNLSRQLPDLRAVRQMLVQIGGRA